jgi:hypothetical protein
VPEATKCTIAIPVMTGRMIEENRGRIGSILYQSGASNLLAVFEI